MTRVNLDMKVENGNKVFTDIFIHGDELWRLQKTHYIRGGDTKTETIDFTRDEYENLFGKLEETPDSIVIENGEVFDGNREQFENCFFSNASNEEIESFCRKNSWSLSINGSVIFN